MEETKGISQIDFERINPKYLTHLEEQTDKIRADVMELVTSIPFIYNLVKKDRHTTKTVPKDSNGKVIVNITEPHILENTDYFRERALYFQKHGTYTDIYPSSHPNSEWMKFWTEESRRCLEGYVREDGEWITGEHYWYLNYCPIIKAEVANDEDTGENITAIRTENFPDFWDGDYLYFHYRHQARQKGLHCCLLKTRRRGYSFKGASVVTLPFYHMRNQKCYAFAFEGEFLYTDGILNDKTWNMMSFIDSNTPWIQPREYKDTDEHKRASYKDPELKIEKGRKNDIIGLTLKNNLQKARGKAGYNVLWEEFGVAPEGLTPWVIALGSMKQGRKVFGLMSAFGTGGTAGEAFFAMESLFYRGDSYSIYTLPNVFDKGAQSSTCGLYIGEYLNREFCYDKIGNSDPIKALIEIVKEWKQQDASSIVQYKADFSITPQDACLRKEGSLFPVTDLKEIASEIMPNYRSFISNHLVGSLVLNTSGSVEWSINTNDYPIHDFPLKDNKNKKGCIEIFQPPVTLSNGQIPHGRYIAGTDPYDDDSSTTTSLGSTFIMDLFTDEIVAEYTGRPATAHEYYENVYRLLKYYNATCMYESFNKGLFAYMDKKHSLYLLADNPKILKQMDYIKGDSYGNKAHPYSEYVYTPAGKKQWKDIKVGDSLFSEKGEITKVIDIPFDNKTDIYKITLWDGRIIMASENHLWKIKHYNQKEEKTLSTKEISEIYKREKVIYKRNKIYIEYNCAIPCGDKVEFTKSSIPIDAYTLGLLIGDGTFSEKSKPITGAQFASCPEDMEEYKKYIPYEVKNTKEHDHFKIMIPNLRNHLKKLNLWNILSGKKFIPDIYKYNDSNTRMNILRGLLDTDGHVEINGFPKFSTISNQLAEDVMFIARSLGYNCKKYKSKAGYKKEGIYHQCNDVYNVVIWTNESVFRLPRKLNKLTNFKSSKSRSHRDKMFITNIEYSHQENAKCVTVDNPTHLYMINEFVVTHNSKGYPPSKQVNGWARRLIADWLITPPLIKLENKPDIANMHKLRSIGLIKELIHWNSDGNFDRVSALQALMIYREEKQKYPYVQEEQIDTDDYFFRNYKPNKQQAILERLNKYKNNV